MDGLDLRDPAVHADPYPVYDKLREHRPVYWSEANQRWFVSRYDDCRLAYRSPAVFSSETYRVRTNAGPGLAIDGPQAPKANSRSILLLDAPEHTRLRGLVSRAFTPRAVRRMRDVIDEVARRLLEAQRTRVAGFDFVEAFAGPLPLLVVAHMLGVPVEDHVQYREWSHHLAYSIEPGLTAKERADAFQRSAGMGEYLMELIRERRACPSDDLVSGLVTAVDSDDRLSDEEIVAMMQILTTAGHETTTTLLCELLRGALADPDLRGRMTVDGALRSSVIEETLRLWPPIQFNTRVLTREVVVCGVTLPSGAPVGLLVAAANRDPRAFADPTTFAPTRGPNHHLSFGYGIHSCLGASLARLEADVVVKLLTREYPDLRPADPDSRALRADITLRGYTAFPAAFDRRGPDDKVRGLMEVAEWPVL
jgi:cytochrome P450